MLRRFVCAAVVLVFGFGIAFADEFAGMITKVEGGKVTFTEFKGKEKGDAKTMPVSDKVKVVKGTFNKETLSCLKICFKLSSRWRPVRLSSVICPTMPFRCRRSSAAPAP